MILYAATPWHPGTRPLDASDFVPRDTFLVSPNRDVQLDLPRSPHARYYKIFDQMNTKIPYLDQGPAEAARLETFYKTHAQSEATVWSLSRIQTCTGFPRRQFQGQMYFRFDITRMNELSSTISEADFPLMNPADLLVLGYHFEEKSMNHGQARFPCGRIKNFLFNYLTELGRQDFELCDNFWEHRTRAPNQVLDGIESRHRGIVDQPELGIIFKGDSPNEKLFFRLSEKHLYPTPILKALRDRALTARKISEDLKDRVVGEINWWLAVRKWCEAAIGFISLKTN